MRSAILSCVPSGKSGNLLQLAIENDPFIVGLPTQHGDFP